MNWSWGKSIVLAFIIFIGLVSWALIKSFGVQIDLVTPNYYEEELKYEDRITEIKAGQEFADEISFKAKEDGLHIQFPKQWEQVSIEGKIKMYRPNDAKKDFEIPIAFNQERMQIIPGSKLLNGAWTVKLSWTEAGRKFYLEKNVFL